MAKPKLIIIGHQLAAVNAYIYFESVRSASMSSESGILSPEHESHVAIPFKRRNDDREAFLALFREGMSLVEATANYLDGPGRRESKCLTPYIALSYATESMRLTTRLTQLATWLLARRAVMNGEPMMMMQSGGANDPLVLPPMSRLSGSRGYDQLPQRLKELIEEGYKLHEKIYRFDTIDRGPAKPVAATRRPNPVAAQVAQIAAAFAR
jgi:regulator of CtrA degradation